MPLTSTQLQGRAVAERAEITGVEAKRVLGALEEIVLEEAQQHAEGPCRRSCTAHRSGQAGANEAQGPKPGYRRGDHDRRQARERRPSCATAREGQGRAAVGAESAPTTRRLKPSAEPISAQTRHRTEWVREGRLCGAGGVKPLFCFGLT